jgi:hypothetical protein
MWIIRKDLSIYNGGSLCVTKDVNRVENLNKISLKND